MNSIINWSWPTATERDNAIRQIVQKIHDPIWMQQCRNRMEQLLSSFEEEEWTRKINLEKARDISYNI